MKTVRARVALYTLLALLAGASAGCSVMESSGRWTRESGESMESYAKSNEGFWASVAGYGGRFNKAVGSSMESMAGGGDSAGGSAGSVPGAQQAGSPAQAQPVQYAAVAPTSTAVAATPTVTHDAATVSRAQARLLELGYRIGKADGILGPKTRGALKEYQRSKGLAESGALDQATLVALGLV
jgi:hypothetical protein